MRLRTGSSTRDAVSHARITTHAHIHGAVRYIRLYTQSEKISFFYSGGYTWKSSGDVSRAGISASVDCELDIERIT